ncbi:MAG TPA: YqgE/AlgH family protein [Sedimenticola sp.]|nr:YqgE/AlgH family protein [Sedimenticola sp.]
MDAESNLTNHFLIAMPGLQDTNFFHTVTYICEHNESGAMGIVLNRPTELRLGDILQQLDIDTSGLEKGGPRVYLGGPVQTERGFVVHTGEREWASTLQITPRISVTTSRDVLDAIARGEGPEHAFIALGYAGWAGGQLEQELSANAWLSGPASEQIIFELPPDQRWEAAAKLLGVDLNLLSGEAGHA